MARSHRRFVAHTHRGVVDELRRSNADHNRCLCLKAQAIAHGVREAVGSLRLGVRLVHKPVLTRLNHPAELRGIGCAEQGDGVAIGIDAVKRDRNAHRTTRERACRHIRRTRRRVAVVCSHDSDRHLRRCTLTQIVHDRVRRLSLARLRASLDADPVLRHEHFSKGRVDSGLREAVQSEVPLRGVDVVAKDIDRRDVTNAHRHFVVIGDGGEVASRRFNRHHRDFALRRERTI